jgi:hypothetical protein
MLQIDDNSWIGGHTEATRKYIHIKNGTRTTISAFERTKTVHALDHVTTMFDKQRDKFAFLYICNSDF